MELPPDLQQKIRNIQGLQAQLQSLNEQKMRIEATIKEIATAKEFLESVSEDDPVYRNVGGLMIHTPKDNAMNDLSEREDLLNVRLKKLTMNIERAQSRFESSRDEINESIKNRGS
ncbi:prefoldin subunit beta [Candidatus Bathyarchaeota archaeon]|nr:prefoldin subunit beta [Candidatus Bathyarchaeota archaeon]